SLLSLGGSVPVERSIKDSPTTSTGAPPAGSFCVRGRDTSVEGTNTTYSPGNRLENSKSPRSPVFAVRPRGSHRPWLALENNRTFTPGTGSSNSSKTVPGITPYFRNRIVIG